MEAVIVQENGAEHKLEVTAVFIRIGVEPNNWLLDEQVKVDDDGYLIVDKVGKTSEASIFAVGDVCNHPLYSGITTSVGQGMAAVKHISQFIRKESGSIYY